MAQLLGQKYHFAPVLLCHGFSNTRKPSQRKGKRATALVYRTQFTKSAPV